MRSKYCIVLLATALGACGHTPHDLPDRGLAAVNAPVVQRADYTVDLAAPGGTLLAGEGQRLNGWFQGLGLGYGDTIYVDGGYADAARAEVAAIAGNYGMQVHSGAPITAGTVQDGSVRVVVSRNRASVPNCPNWDRPALPNYNNQSFSNFGCGVNSALAAMVANPEDLVHGREGNGVTDPQTAAKAVSTYRSAAPTGGGKLESSSTKESN